jgi:hypothetical protein
VQHHRFVATLAPQDLPKGYSKYNSVLLALAIGVLGALLAVYLFFTPPHGLQ